MIWKAMTKRVQGVSDCRRMMSKVINHFHAARFAADLLSPRDARKSLERIVDLCFRHFIKPRRCRRHRRVAHIEFADQRDLERLVTELESRGGRRERNVANALRAILRQT